MQTFQVYTTSSHGRLRSVQAPSCQDTTVAIMHGIANMYLPISDSSHVNHLGHIHAAAAMR